MERNFGTRRNLDAGRELKQINLGCYSAKSRSIESVISHMMAQCAGNWPHPQWGINPNAASQGLE
jgi:hypothetical protein